MCSHGVVCTIKLIDTCTMYMCSEGSSPAVISNMIARQEELHPACFCLYTDALVYNAQSPDEAALVTAARNFGYVFTVSTIRLLGP